MLTPGEPGRPRTRTPRSRSSTSPRRSNGSLRGRSRVEPPFGVPPPGSSGWDQYTARAVADGDYDLGLVPSRAFDALGVDSLRALNTPFLIQSEAAVEAGPRRRGPRRPPRRAASSRRGRPRSLPRRPAAPVRLRRTAAGRRRLRGRDDPDRALRDGRADVRRPRRHASPMPTRRRSSGGAEAAYAWAPGPIATGNVTYFPKVTTLVAAADVPERLRPDQWDLLRDAAAATREWMYSAQAVGPRGRRCVLRRRRPDRGCDARTRSRACARPRHPLVDGAGGGRRCPDRSSSGSAS